MSAVSPPLAIIAVTFVCLFFGKPCGADAEAEDAYLDPYGRPCGRVADIVFVLDESGSIHGPDFTKQLQFVERLIDSFDVRSGRTHVGVLTFATQVRVIFNVGQIRGTNELKTAIRGISQMRGDTYTDEALRRTRVDMFSGAHTRRDVPHIVIVITDGESHLPDKTAYEADMAHRSGLQVFAIGVGGKVIRRELEAIASRSNMVFQVDDYSALESIRQRVVERTCAVVTPAPTTRPTTPSQMIEDCISGKKMDHIWALPDRANAAETAQAHILIRDVTSKMTLSPRHVQVGVTPRVCQPDPGIRLRDHDTQRGFIDALARRLPSAAANTHAHIQYIHSTGMMTASGARADSIKFGLLIVDSAQGANQARAVAEARKAKNARIRLIVIGVGNEVVTSELNLIASSNQDVIRVSSYAQLHSAQKKILDRLCKGMVSGNGLEENFFLNRRFRDMYDNDDDDSNNFNVELSNEF